MGFLKKLKDVNQKGIGQALLDTTMSAVDKVRAGEDGPAPVLRFIRENGYSGGGVASALKAAQPLIGSAEIEFFWSAWLLKYDISAGWRPLEHARGGAAAVVHCVRIEGRVLVLSNEGELITELRPAAGMAPEVSLMNGVTFGLTPKDELDLSNPGVRATEKFASRFGLNEVSAAQIYTQLAKVRIQTEPNLAPKSYQEFPGAVITVPQSSDGQSLRFVVLSTEVEGIVGALSA
jgi:hypothetical protein